MLYHPTTIIITSIIALIISFKHNRVFNIIALSFPIITTALFFVYAESSALKIVNVIVSFNFGNYEKLISVSFFCVLFAANAYSIGQNKKLEVILGSCYGAFALMSLFANDFISMFIGLELMMIFSSAIIFIGGARASFRSAKKYFITHLISSNMIIIGIAYLITKNNDLTIVPVTDLLSNPNYSSAMLYIMLVGMLINIAVFPFSGWMVKYYPKASPSGFLYLISFTTKISVALLAKIFLGLEEMKYIAVIMILYSSFKATMEENIFSILCYLSIMAMGIMLLGISVGTKEAILATTCYLFIHVMYKLLLSISAVILADEANINFCQDIKKINNKILLFGIVLGILMMLNIPLSSSFVIKSALSHLFSDSLIYMLIIFSSFMMVFALPWKKYFSTTKSLDIKLNIYSKVSIIFMIFVLIVIAIFGKQIPVLKEISQFNNLMIFSSDALKQIIVILSGLLAASLYMTHRKDTKPINFIEWLGDVFFGLYPRWVNTKVQKNEIAESWEIKNLEKQILNKLSSVHNQKNAIFIVFIVFIVMLLVLTTSI
ncbi:MAG: hypothetical protein NWP47_04450 [Rickettsiaceae bacterium]|nr:hypothetical protein [Rickettsiaceae bacterium]